MPLLISTFFSAIASVPPSKPKKWGLHVGAPTLRRSVRCRTAMEFLQRILNRHLARSQVIQCPHPLGAQMRLGGKSLPVCPDSAEFHHQIGQIPAIELLEVVQRVLIALRLHEEHPFAMV